jgi:signal transduction histidine kinase
MSTWATGRHRTALRATGHGLLLCVNAMAGLAAVIVTVVSLAFLLLGVGVVLLPAALGFLRATANWGRRLAGAAGEAIPTPYLPRPDPGERAMLGLVHRVHWLLTDPATWRDLVWALLNTVIGFTLGMIPITVLGYAVEGLLIGGGLWIPLRNADIDLWYTFVPLTGWGFAALAGLIGLVVLGLWLGAAPLAIKAHALMTQALLSPTQRSKLAARLRALSETRHEIIDIQAAELRRIERDLHDGAQARLVAIGLKLGAANRYLESDVDKVRALLAEASDASVKALEELRNLVRGIHPPVLAERGLGPAIHALALESPLDIELELELPHRLYPPIESAAYFAVSELLTNAAKHADPQHVEITARITGDLLRIVVRDDGRGGANMGDGTGLRGIARRCATFDGSLDVRSPVGGPTVATLELPCASSSQRISTS